MQDKRGSSATGGNPVAETLQHFSHDIRSAMSDVIGGLRLVDRDRLDAETQLQIDRVQAAGDTLAALVDAALMEAAGDARVARDDGAVMLDALLSALEGRWGGHAHENGAPFRIVRDGPLPDCILVSQVLLERILGNLIGNALRHAPEQGAYLAVHMRNPAGLTLCVCDCGAGYPQSILDQVREGVGAIPMGQSGGTGLGLRIAAELSGQIGASLTLSNTAPQGGGAAELVVPKDLLEQVDTQPTTVETPGLGGLQILVAEDNLTNQTILRQMLDGMGAETVFVADGAAALEALDRQAFDLALIDIEMPRVSGLDVLKAARARTDAVAQMPIVALTAYVLRDNREAIYEAGADGIIGKPISSAAEFGQAILRYAGRPMDRPGMQLAPEGENRLSGRHMNAARFDALLSVAGPSGQAELLQRLHEDLNAVLCALDQAIDTGDLSEVRAQTHILTAVAGAVGAERLNRVAEVLNVAAKRKRAGEMPSLYQPCRSGLRDLIAFVEAKAGEVGVSLSKG